MLNIIQEGWDIEFIKISKCNTLIINGFILLYID